MAGTWASTVAAEVEHAGYQHVEHEGTKSVDERRLLWRGQQ